MQRQKITRTQTNQALQLIPRIPRAPTKRQRSNPGAGVCYVCGAPLRRDFDRGEAFCTNRTYRKYVPEGA